MFYYSWLVCLFGFSLRDALLVGNPNSQSIVSIKNELHFTLLDSESWRLSGPGSYLPGFSPSTAVSPFPQKPTFPNSNSTRNQVDEEPLIVVDASPLNYYCPRMDFAQKAKSRGGTLLTHAYIKESTYSWNILSYSQYRKKSRFAWKGAARNR